MMGRVTDGQESIPWATSLLLTTQPCQLHNPYPSPALLRPLHHSFDILFHFCCFKPFCCVTQLAPTSLPATIPLLTSPWPHLPSFLLFLNLAEVGCLPNWGLIPWFFFMLYQPEQPSLYSFVLSCCAGQMASAQVPGFQPHAATLVHSMFEHHIRYVSPPRRQRTLD